MRKTITYAKLHGTDAFIPEVGGLGTTLPPVNKTMELKMYAGTNGLELVIAYKGHPIECLIPWANVQICKYGPMEVIMPEAVKKAK